MSARTAAKRSAKKRAPRPGQGNPHWERALVTASRFVNWNTKRDGPAPLTLSAGPGVGAKRVDVRLGESVSRETVELTIEIPGGTSRRLSALISPAQACSFEEAVRAVFRAAREEGILRPVSWRDQ